MVTRQIPYIYHTNKPACSTNYKQYVPHQWIHIEMMQILLSVLVCFVVNNGDVIVGFVTNQPQIENSSSHQRTKSISLSKTWTRSFSSELVFSLAYTAAHSIRPLSVSIKRQRSRTLRVQVYIFEFPSLRFIL